MKTKNAILVAVAFAMAIILSVAEAYTQPPPAGILCADVYGSCVLVTSTFEPDCSVSNSGRQCTTLVNLGGGSSYTAPAYWTLAPTPVCTIPLRTRF